VTGGEYEVLAHAAKLHFTEETVFHRHFMVGRTWLFFILDLEYVLPIMSGNSSFR
jgi:hypothetical protein